jgi:hypothetical protein
MIPELVVDGECLGPIACAIEQGNPAARGAFILRFEQVAPACRIDRASKVTSLLPFNGERFSSVARDAAHARALACEPFVEILCIGNEKSGKELALVPGERLFEAPGGDVVGHRCDIGREHIGVYPDLVITP